ncbi:MAG: tetratricopeptide repeat protein [Pirellulales bacterium]
MDAIARQLTKAQRALDAGGIDRAIAIARELTRKHPLAAEPLHFLGRTYCIASKPPAALPYLRRAVIAAPDDPACRQTLARALAELGLIDEAVAAAREAVELECRHGHASTDGQLLLGRLYCRVGRLADAENCFALAVATLPSDLPPSDPQRREIADEFALQAAAAYNNLANVRVELGRHEEAVEGYRRAIGRAPRFADAWTNLAAALLAVGRIDEAVESARRAASLAPRQTAAWLTLGNALSEQGRWTESRRAFDALLSIEPLSLAARYNRSLARLALGEWSAWDDYRLRHAVEPTVRDATGLPSWRGESLAGKTILVRREQGIGTQIMFSGYLPAVANLAEKVLVECDSRLRPLFDRAMPGIDFAPSDEIVAICPDANAGDCGVSVRRQTARPEVEVAIGDLPGLVRRADTVGDWTDGVSPPRLAPDVELTRKWRERLARTDSGLCVGISWRGGGTATARQKRSTKLDQWSPVLGVGGVHFVSLQYGDCQGELAAHAQSGGRSLHRWSDFDPRTDLDDLAALVSVLDLVVSIDNSTVHLAGALLAPLWVLLPVASDWRWLIDRDETPWYPTAKLFRRRNDDEGWAALFEEVARQLERMVIRRRAAATRVG